MIRAYTHLSELVTLREAFHKDGRRLNQEDLSLIKNGAIVFNEQEILWVGKTNDLPQEYLVHSVNLSNHVLTPEIVDSHTHLIFGGERSQEYADRLSGLSYEEIAKRGGGIISTMKHTNDASADELYQLACDRLERINSYGVGTVEIKSGYGLNLDKERELTLIIDRLKKKYAPKIRIFNTFMAAHDVPSSFSSSSDYLDSVVIPLLRELAPKKVIDAVDIFHEKNFFSTSDVERLFGVAQQLRIPRKIHADELNDNEGAELAVKHSALSCDHLLKISDDGVKALSSSNTVASLLPGTAFFLGKPLAPARKLLDEGAKVALASDYNPGSCHCDNLLLIASISAAQLGMNQAELWAGMTLNAAASLGIRDQGALKPGLKPRFSLFNTKSVSEITYNWGRNLAVTLP